MPPPELFIELCPYLFQRCKTDAADEAAAWALLEGAGGYSVVLQHHDAGSTMPPIPPGSVRLDSLQLPPGLEAEYAKMPAGSYARPPTWYWVPGSWADIGPWLS